MAFTYVKSSGLNGKRWMGKVKVGRKLRAVSLGLPAPGNERMAKARVTDLQYEINRGRISVETQAWLGEKPYQEIMLALNLVEKSQHTWQSAADEYLQSKTSDDTRQPPEGKAVHRDRTKAGRRRTVLRMVRWLGDKPFMAEPFNGLLHKYATHLIAAGKKASTIRTELVYPCLWGDWMHSNKLCEKIDRDEVLKGVPRREHDDVKLPTREQDLALMKLLYEHRLGDTYGEPYPTLWVYFLLVRGLGCRPSEAQGLSWATVPLPRPKVFFLDTKDARMKRKKKVQAVPLEREVPVLYQWVKDGLHELWEARDRPRDGAVSLSTIGKHWHSDGAPGAILARICKHNKLPAFTPKLLQKLAIRQWIDDGFPPHAVCRFTGHELSVQEKHYCEQAIYLPPEEEGFNYGRFGVLSHYGQRCWQHNLGTRKRVTSEGDKDGDTQEQPM